jgi:hypothetical protein
VYQTLVFSVLGVSKFGFLSIYPFHAENHNIMPILHLTPKLHRFGFQNYNTQPTQNDIILAINIFLFFLRKKKRKMKIGGGSSHPHGQNGVARPPYFFSKGWLEPPPQAVWGWLNHLPAQEGGLATPKGQKKKKIEK